MNSSNWPFRFIADQWIGDKTKSSNYVDHEFQLNYTKKTIFTALLASLFFLLPCLYWSVENYNFFIDMAHKEQSEWISHLERERNSLIVIFSFCLIGQVFFFALAGRKMTEKIIAPLKILRNHLSLLSRGDYALPAIKVRADDEFHDLMTAYNYCYMSLQAQTKKDLDRLRAVLETTKNPSAHQILSEMIHERKQQLQINENVLEFSKSHDSHHAA